MKELHGSETSSRNVSDIPLESSSEDDDNNIFVTPKYRKGLESTQINYTDSEESEKEFIPEVVQLISTPKKRRVKTQLR